MAVTIDGNNIEQNRRDRIIAAVRSIELADFPSWSDLDILSSQTIVDSIEPWDDEITIDGDAFYGMLNVYVVLNYGRGDDLVSSTEGFPGSFSGKFEEDGSVLIEEIKIDTSSYYTQYGSQGIA